MPSPLVLALSLAVSAAPAPDDGGEPLPASAPTQPYELSAWCYGALSEYLAIYDQVKPDLVAINRLFGDPVAESEPYQTDIAAARKELKVISASVTAAEKASPRPISEEGAAAIRQGRMIWSVAESRKSRELARAWLSWGLPDRCDSNARELALRSTVLGGALKYNAGQPAPDVASPEAVAGEGQTPLAPPPQAAPAAEARLAPVAIVAPAPVEKPQAEAAAPPAPPLPSVDAPAPAAPPSTAELLATQPPETAPQAASPQAATPLPAAPTQPAEEPAVPPPSPAPTAATTSPDEPQEPML